MAWRIEISETAEKQLSKLDKQIARRILDFLRERLSISDDPRNLGEALKGSRLDTYWKYRVGDWRLICAIRDQQIVIVVISVGNRREIYR